MKNLFLAYLAYTLLLGIFSYLYYYLKKRPFTNNHKISLFITPPLVWVELKEKVWDKVED